MAIYSDRALGDRPASWPAWSLSVAFHAALLIAMLVVLRERSKQPTAETPLREAGIVLKRTNDDESVFAEASQAANVSTNVDSSTQERAIEALPTESEVPKLENHLPNVSSIGLGPLSSGEVANAGAMTSGGTGRSTIGSPATVRLFGIEGTGSRFVYVFDRSISMQGAPLRAAKSQLIASWKSLESVHQFQIIFFNHEPKAWDLTGGQQRIAFATDANKRHAARFVRGISASGGTYRLAALRLALGLRPDAIFFLTDTDDPMPAQVVDETVQRAQRSTAVIHTIEFGVGPDSTAKNFLHRLAEETSGNYTYVNTQQLRRSTK